MAEYFDPDGVCIVSGEKGVDLHHLRSRGAGGPDESWNLMPLSRALHTEIHRGGLGRFTKKYPQARAFLLKHGWEYCDLYLRWRHP